MDSSTRTKHLPSMYGVRSTTSPKVLTYQKRYSAGMGKSTALCLESDAHPRTNKSVRFVDLRLH